MIDLTYTLERMLADVDAGPAAGDFFAAPAGPARSEGPRELRLLVRGRTSHEVMPPLAKAFTERFGRRISERQLRADLIHPVKKGIGNAHKRGNRKDPEKLVTARALLTSRGAVVTISDEGDGFDPAAVIEKLKRGDQFYSNHGSGFHRYYKSGAMISFADGGRTLQVRFLARREPGRRVTGKDRDTLGLAADAEYMADMLRGAVRCFARDRATLEACRIYRPDDRDTVRRQVLYALDYRLHGSGRTSSTILSGRLLPAAPAQRDLSIGRRLHALRLNRADGLNVPRPLVVLSQPSIALYRIDASETLRAHLKGVSDRGEAARLMACAGRGLRRLHASAVEPDAMEGLDAARTRLREVGEALVAKLARLEDERATRAGRLAARIVELGAAVERVQEVPTFGDLDWNRLVLDGDRLSVIQFEPVRLSHPGFDVGGFLADLLRFSRLSLVREQDIYDEGRTAFLEAYFADRDESWRHDLLFFVAAALLQRLLRLLGRPKKALGDKVDAFLDELDLIVRSQEPRLTRSS